MLRRAVFVVTLLLFVVSFVPASAQQDASFADMLPQLGNLIPQLMDRHRVVGLSVGIVQDGRVIYTGAFGLADAVDQTPMTVDTVFNAASIGKAVTAWGALRLVEEDLLDLDTPVEQYLTRWHLPESEFDSSGITIRRILSHTAGLSVEGYRGFPPERDLPTLEALLSGQAGYPAVRLIYEPGTRFSYSGGGYTVLQLVMEEVTGMAFADYMQQTVLEPLGMTASSFVPTPETDAAVASAYNRQGRPVRLFRFVAQAAAGLLTTAPDISRFVAAHMPGPDGEPAGRGVITPEHAALAMTAAEATDHHYGLGYFIHPMGQEGEARVAWHDAFNTGWRGLFAVSPSENAGLVMLSNSERGYLLIKDAICALDDWWSADLSAYCQALAFYVG